MLCFKRPHFTILAKPLCTLSCVSSMRHRRASSCFADGCDPYRKACSSWALVQSGPQSTGQPSTAYDVSNGAAGCCNAGPLGHIRPEYRVGVVVGVEDGDAVWLVGWLVGGVGGVFLIYVPIFWRCSRIFGRSSMRSCKAV